MMKNLLFLVASLLFFLTGCGGEDSGSNSLSTTRYDKSKWSVVVEAITEYDKDGDRCLNGRGSLQINNSGAITLTFGINGYGDSYFGDGTIKENDSINFIAKNSEINDKVDFIGYLNSSGKGSGTWVSQTYGCKGNWSATLTEGGIKSDNNSNSNSNDNGERNIAITKIDTIGDVGLKPDLALDSKGYVHISYYDKTNHKIKYATNKSGSWSIKTIDTVYDYAPSKIIVDSKDYVYIFYYKKVCTEYFCKYIIKYASSKVGWRSELAVLTDGKPAKNYTNFAPAIDSQDNIYLTYIDYPVDSYNVPIETVMKTGNGMLEWERKDSIYLNDRRYHGPIEFMFDKSDKVHMIAMEYDRSMNHGTPVYITNQQGKFVSKSLTQKHSSPNADLALDVYSQPMFVISDASTSGITYGMTNEYGNFEKYIIANYPLYQYYFNRDLYMAIDNSGKVFVLTAMRKSQSNGVYRFYDNIMYLSGSRDSWSRPKLLIPSTKDSDVITNSFAFKMDSSNGFHVAYYAYDIARDDGNLVYVHSY